MTHPGHPKRPVVGQSYDKVDGVSEIVTRRSSSGSVVFTAAEAAAMCGVNPRTIVRAREAGKIDGAYQETSGRRQWLMPLEGLLAAGFEPQKPTPVLGQTPDTKSVQSQDSPRTPQVIDLGQSQVANERTAALEAELADLRAQLAEAKADVRVAQAERDAERRITSATEQRAETAERALLMLGTGPARPEPSQHSFTPPMQQAGDVIHPDGHEPAPVVEHQPAPRPSLRERIFGGRQ